MRLFMDIGNSAAKWAFEEELERDIAHSLPYAETGELIPRLQTLSPPSAVHISSVLQRPRLQDLSAWMATHWGLSPRFAESRAAELGVVNGYRDPSQLGVDRWLGLLAAREVSKQPLLIVDCGTATTLDAMDREGHHLGGLILPGLQLFHGCLRGSTDIPLEDESAQTADFATDTATGISSGAMLATTASVEAALTRLQNGWGRDVECLLTGGFAPRVSAHLNPSHNLLPNLILKGLALQAGKSDR